MSDTFSKFDKARKQVRRVRTGLFSEPLEGRVLLSGYALSQIGVFGANAGGANPQSTLVMDSNGNFYGTASAGGAYGVGNVFEIAKGSGVITTLPSFNGTNGANPDAAVTLDASGNLYGTTNGVGVGRDGTVFELSPIKPRLPADFNGDGKQDFSDLLILAQNYGKTAATFAQGDADGDGTVDFADLLILAQNYGSTLLTAGGSTLLTAGGSTSLTAGGSTSLTAAGKTSPSAADSTLIDPNPSTRRRHPNAASHPLLKSRPTTISPLTHAL